MSTLQLSYEFLALFFKTVAASLPCAGVHTNHSKSKYDLKFQLIDRGTNILARVINK